MSMNISQKPRASVGFSAISVRTLKNMVENQGLKFKYRRYDGGEFHDDPHQSLAICHPASSTTCLTKDGNLLYIDAPLTRNKKDLFSFLAEKLNMFEVVRNKHNEVVAVVTGKPGIYV